MLKKKILYYTTCVQLQTEQCNLQYESQKSILFLGNLQKYFPQFENNWGKLSLYWQISLDICRYLQHLLYFLVFLQNSSDFCKFPQISAEILRKYKMCSKIHITLFSLFCKFSSDFCTFSSDFCKYSRNFAEILGNSKMVPSMYSGCIELKLTEEKWEHKQILQIF